MKTPATRILLTVVTALALGGPAVAQATPAQATPAEAPVPAARATPGDGWYLTTIAHGRPTREGLRAKRQRLVLVAPDGGRTPAGPTIDAGWQLVDWSSDGRTALLTADRPHRAVLRVDLPTGEVDRERLPDRVAQVLLAPGGDGLLTVDYEGQHDTRAPFEHRSDDGTVTRLSADVDGPVLPTPDGAAAVTGGTRWNQGVIRVLSLADGSVLQRIPAPRGCSPVRWWDAHTALLTCMGRAGTTTLALADLDAGRVSSLTRRVRPQRQDLGHLDGWRAGGRLYVEVAGPCGYVYLGRQHGDGRITKVRVPHAVGSVLLVDARDGRLTLEHALSCDGAAPRSALTRFDPRTGRERPLVVLPRTAAFGAILRYGDPQPTGF